MGSLASWWGGGGGGGGGRGGEKTTSEGKKIRKKRSCHRACPCVELSPSLLSNTVYQCIELTKYIGPQRIHVSIALCIIVLWSQGSNLSVIKRLKEGIEEIKIIFRSPSKYFHFFSFYCYSYRYFIMQNSYSLK